MKCDMRHVTLLGWWTLAQYVRSLALKVWKLWCHVTRNMWHVTSGIWHMTYDTHGMLNIVTKFQFPSSNGLKDCFVWRFPLYSYLTTICYIQFHFIFILLKFFNPHPDWVIFYLVFSFGQHLLWWEGLFPFALWKMPSYNPWPNSLIRNALFQKGQYK